MKIIGDGKNGVKRLIKIKTIIDIVNIIFKLCTGLVSIYLIILWYDWKLLLILALWEIGANILRDKK